LVVVAVVVPLPEMLFLVVAQAVGEAAAI
jgi:hypothetical protein